MNRIVIFILWFLAAEALLTAAQLPLRKKRAKPALRAALIAGKALLAVAFAALVMAGPVQLRFAQPLMTALYAALLADAVADAVYSLICAAGGKDRKFAVARAAGLAFGVLFWPTAC